MLSSYEPTALWYIGNQYKKDNFPGYPLYSLLAGRQSLFPGLSQDHDKTKTSQVIYFLWLFILGVDCKCSIDIK